MKALTELTASPLFGITLTLAVYVGAVHLWRRAGRTPLLTPVMTSIVAIGGLLLAFRVPYERYLAGGSFISFLLGPATVALAVPLYRAGTAIRRFLAPIAVSVLVGSATSVLTALLVVHVFGGGRLLSATLAPKAATTPISIAVSASTGGIASLTAVITILTGVLGAVAGPSLLGLFRIRDERVRGLAIGISSHGIGTARALDEGPRTGAFSALGMALSGVATAVIVPLVFGLLG